MGGHSPVEGIVVVVVVVGGIVYDLEELPGMEDVKRAFDTDTP